MTKKLCGLGNCAKPAEWLHPKWNLYVCDACSELIQKPVGSHHR